MTQKTMTKGILNQIIHNLVKNVTFLLKFIQLISKNWHLKIHYVLPCLSNNITNVMKTQFSLTS